MAQYLVDDDFVKEFLRIKKKVDGIKGPGIRNTPDTLTFPQPDSTGGNGGSMFKHMVLVAVTEAAEGNGKYYGTILGKVHGEATGSTGLGAGDLGDTANVIPALIYNAAEVGAATHGLTELPRTQTIFIGYRDGRVDEDRRALVIINGFDLEECS
jgi:hypothetical protein